MALTTGTNQKTEAKKVNVADTVLLTLTMYKVYNRHKAEFLGGKAYRFTKAQAAILLEEHDTGRPIWKLYKAPTAPKPRHVIEQEAIVDHTAVEVLETLEEEVPSYNSANNLGDDSEIKDILDAVVTV